MPNSYVVIDGVTVQGNEATTVYTYIAATLIVDRKRTEDLIIDSSENGAVSRLVIHVTPTSAVHMFIGNTEDGGYVDVYKPNAVEITQRLHHRDEEGNPANA